MAVEAAEIRISELADAVAFARTLGSEFEARQVITSRSLIARDGDQIVGTVLCVKDLEGGAILEVTLAKDGPAGGLAQQLIDRVLPKIRMRGVHRCQIITRGGAEEATFWQGADWFAQINVRCEVVADADTDDQVSEKTHEPPASENPAIAQPQAVGESVEVAEPPAEGEPGDDKIETAA